jgi:16S rRNA (cytosine1402-N4)-methyltransferase
MPELHPIAEVIFHVPVLIDEVITYLAPKAGGVYVDVTFGGGGHTRAILQADPKCRVIAFDWDKDTIDRHSPALMQEFPDRIQFIWGNFSHLARLLAKQGIKQVDGILADFGTSQFQLKYKAGFSFALDTPLDMRMSPAHQTITAEDIINRASEEELATIFYRYAEERKSRAIARAIVATREKQRLKTTGDLVKVVARVIPFHARMLHPATKIFQALRIVVNHELENIQAFLSQVGTVLQPGGRVVCISFHSLEDRLVKHFFKENKAEFELLTPHVVEAKKEEVQRNPSARSAKLRAAQKRLKVFDKKDEHA